LNLIFFLFHSHHTIGRMFFQTLCALGDTIKNAMLPDANIKTSSMTEGNQTTLALQMVTVTTDFFRTGW
jgi:hypothetical protein